MSDVDELLIETLEEQLAAAESRAGNLAADLLEERQQRREVTAERDRLTDAAIEHARRHQALFDEWVRERAQLVGTLTAIRRCCELGATRRHQIETAAILALLDGVPEVVSEWDLESALAARNEALLRQRRYKAAYDSARQRAYLATDQLSSWQSMWEDTVNANRQLEAERDEARDEVVRLGRALDEAVRERDLAIAHDTQPYPTADAYERACAALHRANAELGRLRTIIVELGAGEAAEPEEQIEALRPEGSVSGLCEVEPGFAHCIVADPQHRAIYHGGRPIPGGSP